MPDTLWALSPHDTLVLGNATLLESASSPALSMELPWPSTVAGMVRSRAWAKLRESGPVNSAAAADLKRIAIAGPWLATENPFGMITDILIPAPADCVWYDERGSKRLVRHRLEPLELRNGEQTGLHGTTYVGAKTDLPNDKPTASAPVYWPWRAMLLDWLRAPTLQRPFALWPGAARLPHESRTHVELDPTSGTAVDGQLYRADHVRYSTEGKTPLSIVFTSAGLTATDVTAQPWASLGGETRISSLRAAQLDAGLTMARPLIPDGGRFARVLLLTPAKFREGSVPEKIAGKQVMAAAVGRPLAVSGWDFEAGGPKHTKRYAPAGSVYWVELNGTTLSEFADEVWKQSVSLDAQDKLDGYGIAVVGVA